MRTLSKPNSKDHASLDAGCADGLLGLDRGRASSELFDACRDDSQCPSHRFNIQSYRRNPCLLHHCGAHTLLSSITCCTVIRGQLCILTTICCGPLSAHHSLWLSLGQIQSQSAVLAAKWPNCCPVGSVPLWRLSAHDAPACSLSFSPAAPSLLATASTDKKVRI